LIFEYLAFAGIGRVFIWLIQKFPFPDLPFIGKLFKDKLLEQLFSCDLCLGVWVYTVLSWLTNINVELGLSSKILSYIITGAITSFLMHLITVGWNTKFSTYYIE